MADYYALQQVGVADSTLIPPAKADGSQVGAKVSAITASKSGAQAIAAGDRMYLGKLRAGERLKEILLTTDTSLATTTVSIGTTALPSKYVAAKTLTVVDTPTPIGPKASTLDDGMLTADEDLWATFAVAGIGAAVLLTFDLEITSVK